MNLLSMFMALLCVINVDATTCYFNPRTFLLSRTFRTVDPGMGETLSAVYVPDHYLYFSNASNWICGGNYGQVPVDNDDVILQMTNLACDWDGLNGARMIIDVDTPALNSFKAVFASWAHDIYTTIPSQLCVAHQDCVANDWNWPSIDASSCNGGCPENLDRNPGGPRQCVNSVVVNAGAKLKATHVELADRWAQLNLNGGTVESATFLSVGGWITGTGTIKATSSVETRIDPPHGSTWGGYVGTNILPGWYSNLAPIYDLSSWKGCSAHYPRWAPNGERNMYGDLLFDTPVALFNSTETYFKDMTTLVQFPGRAKVNVPYDTITVTGTLNLVNLKFNALRLNNCGNAKDLCPWGLNVSTTPNGFLWGSNPQFISAGQINNIGPTQKVLIYVWYTMWPILGFNEWPVHPTYPSLNGDCRNPWLDTLGCSNGGSSCLDLQGCTSGSETTLSFVLTGSSGSCPDTFAASQQVDSDLTSSGAIGTDPAGSTSSGDRNMSVIIPAIVVPVAVVGVGVGLLIYILWRRHVKVSTAEMAAFARQASLQDMQDVKAANAALRMPPSRGE